MTQIHRLRGQELKNILRSGRRIESPLFHIMVKKNDVGCLRIGCVVSRAVDKRATVRNRLRRRAREWAIKQEWLRCSPRDAAVVFKKSASGASRAKLYEELERAFQEIR